MLGDSFGHTEQDTFQVIKFAGKLDFHDNDFTLAIQRLDVDPIELIVTEVLVAFTFQNLIDDDLFIE